MLTPALNDLFASAIAVLKKHKEPSGCFGCPTCAEFYRALGHPALAVVTLVDGLHQAMEGFYSIEKAAEKLARERDEALVQIAMYETAHVAVGDRH